MNAIGPIEAKIKAKGAAVRARLFAPAPKPIVTRDKLEGAKPEEIVKKYTVYDINMRWIKKTGGPARTILCEVANKHEIPVPVMCGPSRNRAYVAARHEAMYRIHTEIENMSLPMIGRLMGDRDHTTVLAGIKRHAARMKAGKA